MWRDEALEDYLARLADVRFTGEWLPGWQAGTLGGSRPAHSAARLAELDVPILMLHGRQDLMFPAALAEAAAETLPGARAVIIDDAAHMAHIDQPEAWLAAVRDFLDRR